MLALFLLVTAAVGASQMFQASVRASGYAVDESIALFLAEEKVREIRLWTEEKVGGSYNFSGRWNDGVDDSLVWADGKEPSGGTKDDVGPPFDTERKLGRFLVQARAWRYRLYTPARGLTDANPTDGSARLVEVTVRWVEDAGRSQLDQEKLARESGPRGRPVSVLALVPEPLRTLEHIDVGLETSSDTLDPIPSIPADDWKTIRAKGKDGIDPLPDVAYRWQLTPKDGNGTLVESLYYPDKAFLSSFYRLYGADAYNATGKATLEVHGMAGGRELWKATEVDFAAGTPAKSPPGPDDAPK